MLLDGEQWRCSNTYQAADTEECAKMYHLGYKCVVCLVCRVKSAGRVSNKYGAKRQVGNPYPPCSLYNIVTLFWNLICWRESSRVWYFMEITSCQNERDSCWRDWHWETCQPSLLQMRWRRFCRKKFSTRKLVLAYGTLHSIVTKFYGVWASDEHQNLEIGQYEIGEDEIGTHLRFKGQSSKNYQGGLQHRRVTPKDLWIYVGKVWVWW